jgi:hypothetical protein
VPSARLTGLQLVTETSGRPSLIAEMTLRASAAGLGVASPTGRLVRHYTWPEITVFTADDAARDAGGVSRQVLALAADGRRHQFLVPAPDLAAFLADVARIDAQARRDAPSLLRRSSSSSRRRNRLAAAIGLRRPRHAAPPKVRIAAVGAGIGALALVATSITLTSIGSGGASAANVPHLRAMGTLIMPRLERDFGSAHAISLPAATAPPAPAPPALAAAPAMAAHEIFGFAPYWTLADSSHFDLAHLTTLAYFSVDVNGDGTVVHSGSGWDGYQSQALADLVTRAHAAGDRVVLTATCFGQSSLDQLASDPAGGTRLAPALVQLVSAKNLDGINLDFEGTGNKDHAGIDRVVSQVSAAMRQANPHWQVTMDTYASSAGGPGRFFDIPGLAPSVDAFFVMAYDMNDFSRPSPTAPLTGPSFSVLDAVQQYTAVVAPSKVILGVPYYGYDWPTAGPGIGDPATGPPTPVTYSGFTAAGHPVYWDPITQTPWTSYQVGTQWHQAWLDDPTSMTLKARLANTYHIAGLGIWALGMDGDAPAMLAALLGNGPVVKDLQPGPGATPAPGATPSTPSTTTTTAPGASSGSGSGTGSGTAGSGSTTTTTSTSTTTTTSTTSTTTTSTTVPLP